MEQRILEACVDSVESAIEAEKGGADRFELCSGLVIGGITPTPSLYQEVRSCTDVPVHVLIRPRFGDFYYTDHEFEVIREEIKQFKKLGASGVVIGILDKDGSLDVKRMEILMEAARGMSVTLHRAFDVCKDPYLALEQARKLGISSILTSGQENSCIKGKELIQKLVKRSGGNPQILVGSGVDADAIRLLKKETGACAFHMSGKVNLESEMQYRKEGVNMGLDSLSEFQIFRTSEDRIREAKKILIEA